MAWVYRVVKNKTKVPLGEIDLTYAIHTVFIDKYGTICEISDNNVFPIAGNIKDLKHQMLMMLEACNKPVIDYNTGEEQDRN
jgi:hypothetical protein